VRKGKAFNTEDREGAEEIRVGGFLWHTAEMFRAEHIVITVTG